MKTIITIIFVFLIVGNSKAEDPKYVNAMKKNIANIDSLKTVQDFIDASNAFQRIGKAEKDKWLPYYYSAYLTTLASFVDTTSSKKDSYLDHANEILLIADSLQPNESEIYNLKGLILQGRLQIDPMNRYMQYSAEMNAAFQKAQQLDPTNPRPDYLMAIIIMYTPEQFGGGGKVAKPMFEKAIQKFDQFLPKNELMPSWGRAQAENFLKRIP